METFFLHDCVPDSSPEEFHAAFREAFSKLQELEVSLHNDDEIVVATLIDPKRQRLGSEYLQTLTHTEDKDFQTFIYSKLTRYPAEAEMFKDMNSLLLSDDDNSLEEELISSLNYELLGKDAMYVALAKKADWISFSLPLHQELKNDFLRLNHRETKAVLSVENYYGTNNAFIFQFLKDRRKFRLTRYEQLLDILEGGNVVTHNEFRIKLDTLSTETFRGALDLIKAARNDNMLMPCRPDGKRLKKCDVASNKHLYELRTQNYNGMRVYFDQEGDTIFLIDIDFKSNYPSKNAQTKALKKAAFKVSSLKAKHNSK